MSWGVAKELSGLAIALLALLSEHPMHPYEMHQLMTERGEDRLIKIRAGSLYHKVSALQNAGLVEIVCTSREGNRPERTTYRITAEGVEALQQVVYDRVAKPVNEYPIFPLAVAELHNLPAEETIQALRSRIVALEIDERTYLAHRDGVQARALPQRYYLDLDYSLIMIRAELTWLRATVDQFQTGELQWQ
ncbi:MAG: PadR family transcriptional regulator [Antricoccus sp.]